VKKSNVIIAQTPAKVITVWDKFAEKSQSINWNLDEVSKEAMIEITKRNAKLVKR